MGQIGHSSPQQWSEEFTAAYMGSPHQHTFLKIGQVFKQAEGCQNGLKIHFVAYNPPNDGPKLFKNWSEKFLLLYVLTRSRLSHTF